MRRAVAHLSHIRPGITGIQRLLGEPEIGRICSLFLTDHTPTFPL